MLEKEINIQFKEYLGITSLEEDDRLLILEARKAIEGSYSPYSKFKVGSAIRIETGEIILGANQENIAYPSGICAERVVLFYAGTKTEGVESIAIACQNEKGEWVESYPCGACLQVMLETEKRANKKLRIIVQIDSEHFHIFEGVNSLLPFGFSF